MPLIVIATCKKFPELTPSDTLLAAALQRLGAGVAASPWNGDFAVFARADAVIIRSTWDYFDQPAAFASWIDRLDGEVPVFNPPDALRWSMSKHYLKALSAAGVATPPFRPVRAHADDIDAAMAALGVTRAVVKPFVGGTASGLSLLDQPTAADLAAAAARLGGDGFVQAFAPEVQTAGEISCVFIDSRFSHAIRKTPKAGDIRVQEEHGGTSARIDAPGWIIDAAAAILRQCPPGTLYARIDGVPRDKEFLLMEAELVEPELFFTYCPEAAARLAAACLERMKSLSWSP